jgi:asparagine synthase (glutamine-hydrolysing)
MVYHDPATGLVVLLNGEIYNYNDLWNELSREGYWPSTDLEAELIARLYAIHGTEFASRLKGMFAIAILDVSKLILARDKFGIKPLYYCQAGKTTLVCSEIKGLLAHPKISPTLDTTALEETYVFGYVYSQEKTFFQGIYQVLPGWVVSIDSNGVVSTSIFGVLPRARESNGYLGHDYPTVVQQTRRLLIQAAERMLQHGTMDKGLYLSGGVDSTTIAYVARRELDYPLKTFTLGDSPDNPDFQMARLVANAIETDHKEFLISTDDYWRWLPDYLAHYESLMAGGVFHIQGGLAFHILSRFISDHVRVAFTGEGADELFGGYYWIYTHPLGFSDRIKGRLSSLQKNSRVREFVGTLFPDPEDEGLYRRNLFDHLLRGGLSNYHLQSVDRSGGAFGFEIRPLYLDDNLSQWAMELPIEYKVPDKRTTKKVLRDAFRGDFENLGIQEVTTRLKMGMPSAVANLDAKISEQVETTITDEEIRRHPLSRLMGSKMDLLLFDLFEHIFFYGWDHHSDTPPPRSFLSRVWPK